tara:strand:- start:350 stop:514 length:165 start_codon:yes stop_codon:yes gene_type:complete
MRQTPWQARPCITWLDGLQQVGAGALGFATAHWGGFKAGRFRAAVLGAIAWRLL